MKTQKDNTNIQDGTRAEEVKAMLEEDRRRRRRLTGRFDPISGAGSTGKRRAVVFPATGRLYLPSAMLADARMKRLIAAGDLRGPADMEEFERLRCLYDFPYWAAKYVYIKQKGGGDDVLFRLNPPQRKLVECFERQRLAGKPIRVIMVKARQWGGSTCSQLYMAWLQLIHSKGLNSLIIAHQAAGSEEIQDMYSRMMGRYPVKMLCAPGEEYSETEKKTEGVGRSRSAFRVIRRNCKVKVGTAERPDSCRGGDYSLVHLSEVGIWKRTDGKMPEDIVRSACSGVLYKEGTMIVYESTANGSDNFFHHEYKAAKRGKSQFEPLFVSWFEIPQYSLAVADREAFARMLMEGRGETAEPDERMPSGSYLWKLWEAGATLDAINWYVSERAKYSDQNMMASEYPSDDVEAFARTGCTVFDRYAVERLRADCVHPRLIGDIEGLAQSGPDALRGLRITEKAYGPLKVWGRPYRQLLREREARSGVRDPSLPERYSEAYLVVVDVGGRSAKADWSVITVFSRIGMLSGKGAEVVAQWRGHTDIDLLAWKAAQIARWYDDALLVIESNTIETHDPAHQLDGDMTASLLVQLRDGYPNLYARTMPDTGVSEQRAVRYGFHTNSATKPMVIATLVRLIREKGYIEREEACLEEYLNYEQRQSGSYAAAAGCHDDMLMTRAIGLHISEYEMSPPRPVYARRREFAGYTHQTESCLS